MSFEFKNPGYILRRTYKDGKWGLPHLTQDTTINLSIASTCLHYGQEAFEGCKAYMGKDGKIRLFRIKDNGERFIKSCSGVGMPCLDVESFIDDIKTLVNINKDNVPTYESGNTLYIRPLIIGTSPKVGVDLSDEYEFILFCIQAGQYVDSLIRVYMTSKFDRASAKGTGQFKVGGNYAASLRAHVLAKDLGYDMEMYTDPVYHKYIDECGGANFFGIINNTYVTPYSSSILASITNDSIIKIAEDMGYMTERRPILKEELDTFDECGCCGTAAVMTAIKEIYDDVDGCTRKYTEHSIIDNIKKKLVDIQRGDELDRYNWVTVL